MEYNRTSQAIFCGRCPCCGGVSLDDPVQSAATPVWAFLVAPMGRTVPVLSASRKRIAALRKAGAHPLYTEYDGVDHNSPWEWAYTQNRLLWNGSSRRSAARLLSEAAR